MADANPQAPKLQELFSEIWTIYEFVDNCDEPLADDKVQDKVYFGVKKCELAIQMVNDLQLFSNNESLDEVATSELKYMLLSGILGFLTAHTTRAERLPLVKKAKAFYTDYVRLCKNYEVTDIDLPSVDEVEEAGDDTIAALTAARGMNMQAMAATRATKIEQFRKKKEMEKRMKELHTLMEQSSDEEVQREYYIMLLKRWVDDSMEDIDSINSEIPILEHMARMKAEQKKHHHPDDKKRASPPRKGKPFRPFILTKDMVQKSVFGAGYPARPTFTIEEFYQQKVEDGTFQIPDSAMGNLSLHDRAANPELAAQDEENYMVEQEHKVEMDDEEELRRKRELDDWKDDHRRGWGNRKNML